MSGKQIESRASVCQARLNIYIVKSVFSLYHWVPQFEGEWNISFPQRWEDNLCRLNQNEQLCPPTYLPNHVPNFPRDLGQTQPTTCSINFMASPSHPSICCYKPSRRPPGTHPDLPDLLSQGTNDIMFSVVSTICACLTCRGIEVLFTGKEQCRGSGYALHSWQRRK